MWNKVREIIVSLCNNKLQIALDSPVFQSDAGAIPRICKDKSFPLAGGELFSLSISRIITFLA